MDFQLVQLRNGSYSIRSLSYGETLHPGIGPALEGESLYVRQLRLTERIAAQKEPFVIWDVGLGAAANAIAVLGATASVSSRTHLISFDHSIEPLKFALAHSDELKYLRGYESRMEELCRGRRVEFRNTVWETHIGDFPSFLRSANITELPAPHAVLYDPFSPAKNPEMWTQPLFARLFELLAPQCSLATFSRSTFVRGSLLLAGFYVGVGLATGEKEETTMAANDLELIDAPLDRRWLERARRSSSAEPLWEPVFRKAPLGETTCLKLKAHPQFAS
jgi:tRNA U34 5-methylaminomethyl-2-thiouridine-forming methyltransferase MnmC